MRKKTKTAHNTYLDPNPDPNPDPDSTHRTTVCPEKKPTFPYFVENLIDHKKNI